MKSPPGPGERPVQVRCGRHLLKGILAVPPGARGVVLFAHGSGSGRHSPRNQYVARCLQQAGLATLLIDLLEEEEATSLCWPAGWPAPPSG
jgi:putative phosphoribosyl transferase